LGHDEEVPVGRPTKRSLVGGAAGLSAALLAGIGLGAIPADEAPTASPPATIDAAHTPPLLVLPGEPITLRYAIVCPPREDGAPCDGSGEVFLRAGDSGAFSRFPLQRGDDSKDGRYFLALSPEIAAAREGFSYYAVLRDEATGATVTVPSGGETAPQHSLRLAKATEVRLATHAFGNVRKADARVVAAEWGADVGEVGLSGSPELGLTGPSAFDVTGGGEVTVLDGVNGRIQRWSQGHATAISLAVSDGLSDLVVEPDGTLDVLEPATRERPYPRLSSFTSDGKLRWTQRLSDRTWAKLARGPDGPVVQQQPSEQWLPAAEGGKALPRVVQAHRGRPGRRFGNGRSVVVERVGSGELRIAETAANGIARAWRISSATPLGEVQLAEPLGNRLVVVVKTYDGDHDEFEAFVLDRSGVIRRFAVPSASWTESAPLARFRLAGPALYQLGSTPAGAFVDRFDLEVSP
jgi:hypothetical protein